MSYFKRFWMWLKGLLAVVSKLEPVIDKVQLLAKKSVDTDYEVFKRVGKK